MSVGPNSCMSSSSIASHRIARSIVTICSLGLYDTRRKSLLVSTAGTGGRVCAARYCWYSPQSIDSSSSSSSFIIRHRSHDQSINCVFASSSSLPPRHHRRCPRRVTVPRCTVLALIIIASANGNDSIAIDDGTVDR